MQEEMYAILARGGLGLEIGPTHNPQFPKMKYSNIRVLDHLSQDELRALYAEHPWRSRIEAVDYVCKGEKYADLCGPERFDFIYASHVLEHVSDLVEFLNQCESILKPGGFLGVAVPYKLACFDHFRPLSALSAVIDAHLAGAKDSSVGQRIEGALYFTRMKGPECFDPRSVFGSECFLSFGDRRASPEYFREVLATAGNLDGATHIWSFTPSHFRLLLDDLFHLGLIRLRERRFWYFEGSHEFLADLSLDGHGPRDEQGGGMCHAWNWPGACFGNHPRISQKNPQ